MKQQEALQLEVELHKKKIRQRLEVKIGSMMREITHRIVERKKAAHLRMITMAISNHYSHSVRNKLLKKMEDGEEAITQKELQKLRVLTFGEA